MTEKPPSHDTKPPQDWTAGPAKWAAVIVLGAASIFGIGWSILTRTHTPEPPESRGIPVHAAQPQSPTDPEPEPRPSETTRRSEAEPPPRLLAPAIPESAVPRELVQGPHLPTWERVTPPTPAEPESKPQSETDRAPDEAPAAIRINVNRADRDELQLLPGIGPVMADRIVEDRTRFGFFRSLDDLERISGIGPRTVEQLRPHAVVRERELTPPDEETR